MSKLFFSYSHKDESLRNELEIHLAPLQRDGLISSWHDRRITAGSDFGQSIDAALEESGIVVLLISSYFLASPYCMDREMSRALERHAQGTAVVVPVILHPCDWQSSPFARLLVTPTDGKPVSQFANLHEAFAIVARDIRRVAEKLATAEPARASARPKPAAPAVVGGSDLPRSSNLRVKRKFDDHEIDGFIEDSYEYIARFFEGSLLELEKRNPQIKTRFKRMTETNFSASVYENGKRAAQCAVWYGGGQAMGRGIAYSTSDDGQRNSYNEMLHVVDDGYVLALKPMGFRWPGAEKGPLTAQGAAEMYWSMLVETLQ